MGLVSEPQDSVDLWHVINLFGAFDKQDSYAPFFLFVEISLVIWFVYIVGRSAHVITFEVGAALEDEKWQAPAYCFIEKEELYHRSRLKSSIQNWVFRGSLGLWRTVKTENILVDRQLYVFIRKAWVDIYSYQEILVLLSISILLCIIEMNKLEQSLTQLWHLSYSSMSL